jgi:hypothetical protein
MILFALVILCFDVDVIISNDFLKKVCFAYILDSDILKDYNSVYKTQT